MSEWIAIGDALEEVLLCLANRLRVEGEMDRADVLSQLAGAWSLADKHERDTWHRDVARVNAAADPATVAAFDQITAKWTPGQPPERRPGFVADVALFMSDGRRPTREQLKDVARMFVNLGYGDNEVIAGLRLAVARSKVAS